MDNLKYVLIALGVLVVLFFVSRMQQSGYNTQADAVFPDNTQTIASIELWTKDDTLTLKKEGEDWILAEHDSLEMRPNKMDPFFERVLGVKKGTLISKNSDNWSKYSIADSSGTHIKLHDGNGKEMAYAVFGRSSRDWSHNYVRTKDEDEVYLTDQSVIHLLYPRASYWGEKPKPDSTSADSAVAGDLSEIGVEGAAEILEMSDATTTIEKEGSSSEAAGPAIPETEVEGATADSTQ